MDKKINDLNGYLASHVIKIILLERQPKKEKENLEKLDSAMKGGGVTAAAGVGTAIGGAASGKLPGADVATNVGAGVAAGGAAVAFGAAIGKTIVE